MVTYNAREPANYKLVIVGTDKEIQGSNDGSTWASTNFPHSLNKDSVCFDGYQWVRINQNGDVSISLDGATWDFFSDRLPLDEFADDVSIAADIESGVVCAVSNTENKIFISENSIPKNFNITVNEGITRLTMPENHEYLIAYSVSENARLFINNQGIKGNGDFVN